MTTPAFTVTGAAATGKSGVLFAVTSLPATGLNAGDIYKSSITNCLYQIVVLFNAIPNEDSGNVDAILVTPLTPGGNVENGAVMTQVYAILDS